MGVESKIKGERGEEAVNELTFHTYLKYWCYPSPKDELGNKNEICDLMIIFKEVVIFIAVKNYSFDGNYEKYFKSTLQKATSQLQGAERKMFHSNRDIYFKHPDKLIEGFQKDKVKVIHRIIINLNNDPLFYPACVATNSDGFVHVFNWDAFLRLVIELDTIPDFIQFLNERQNCFIGRTLIMMTGEENDYSEETSQSFLGFMSSFNPIQKPIVMISGNELDLLADYLFHGRKFNGQLYSKEYNSGSFELDGKWKHYLNQPEVKLKKEDDRLSYFVDEFVKREVLYKTDSLNLEIATELLSLSRFDRRVVGKHFFEFVERYINNKGNFVARRYGVMNDIVIGFLLHDSELKHDHIMILLQVAMEGYCVHDNYKTKKMIMISVSNKMDGLRFGYLGDIKPFPKEYEGRVLNDLKLFGWFTNVEQAIFHIKEYPDG